jgi:acyl-[acyl carrier protein]--UDP-N-acetylglucosamine O-acyltransferase
MPIHSFAVVETEDIGERVTIGEFAIVRAGARLGNDVVIHPHVVIEAGVVIQDGVEIFPGAYIGKEPKGAGALARPLQFEQGFSASVNVNQSRN